MESRALCVTVKTPLLHWHPGLRSKVRRSVLPGSAAQSRPHTRLAVPALLPLPPARSSPPRPVVSSFALPGTPSLRSHHARPNKRRCERGMLPPRAALPRSGRRRLTPTAPDARTCCGLFPGCRPPPSRLHRLPLDPDDPLQKPENTLTEVHSTPQQAQVSTCLSEDAPPTTLLHAPPPPPPGSPTAPGRAITTL